MSYSQEEFVWSATLDKKNPEHVWSPPDSDTEEVDDSIIHKLRVKNAFLGSKVKKELDELNAVELETTGYKEDDIKCPLVIMKSSSHYQCTVDQSFNRPVKFTLTEGNGPIHLVGSYILEFGNGKEDQDDEGSGEEGGSEGDVEEEEEVDEDMTEEDSPPPKPKKNTKKLATNGVKNGKKRKARNEDYNGNEDDSDDEETKQSPKKKKVYESTVKQNKSKKSNK